MKPRRLPPDTRLDWRDPDMPCFELSNTEGMIELTPNRKQSIAQRRLDLANRMGIPSYADDPTYNSKRKSNPNG